MWEHDDFVSLGSELKRAREARGLPIQAMATMSCIRERHIEELERGECPDFPLQTLRSMIRGYLNVMGRTDLWARYDRLLVEEESTEVKAQPVTHDTEFKVGGDEVEHFENEGAAFQLDEMTPKRRTLKLTPEDLAPKFVPITSGEPHHVTSPRTTRPGVGTTDHRQTPYLEPGEKFSLSSHGPAMQGPFPRRRRSQETSLPKSNPVVAPEPEIVEEKPAQPQQPLTPPRARRVPRSNSPLLMKELGRDDQRPQRRRLGGLVALLILLLLLIGAGVLLYKGVSLLFGDSSTAPVVTQTDGKDLEFNDDLPAVNVVSVNNPNTATTPAVDATQPQPETEVVVASQLTIRVVKKECWVKAEQNGKTIFGKVMKKGDKKTFDLNAPLKVTYGAAQNAEISFDGATFKPAGDGVLKTQYDKDSK